MRVDSTLQKLEIYVVAAVAVVLVSFFLSESVFRRELWLG